MKNVCKEWKDQLLEAALTDVMTHDFEEHLRTCAKCSGELEETRARKARLDALLPIVARGAEPSADFRAQVLAAAERGIEEKHARPWRTWTLAGAMAAVATALIIGVIWYRGASRTIPESELAAAQKLAEWRAPSDTLLVTPGGEILRTMPRFGDSYLNVPVKKAEEE
jgi:hypothetical protein